MNIWQKNFIFVAFIFTIILYACIFLLVTPSIISLLEHSKETAISEEYAISRSLDSTFNNLKKQSHKSSAELFARNYEDSGIFLEIGSDSGVLFSNLPFSHTTKGGTLSWVKQNNDTYINISDQLTSGYYFIYMKSVTEVVGTSNKQCVSAVLLGVGVILALFTLLYFSLKKINKPIDRLAHELRTPLTVISGYAEALMISNMSEEQRYLATRYILDESKHLTQVSEKLLTIANLRQRKIDKVSVDIEDLFIHAQKTYGSVKYKVSWKRVTGDRLLLQSLINNLTANAIKASPKDSTVDLTASSGKIIVRDFGKGMSSEELEYVNDPFRKDNPFGRNGLGVPLCHEIAKLHKAVLHYTSEEGSGTTATITFTT